jgi:hypothetical protein
MKFVPFLNSHLWPFTYLAFCCLAFATPGVLGPSAFAMDRDQALKKAENHSKKAATAREKARQLCEANLNSGGNLSSTLGACSAGSMGFGSAPALSPAACSVLKGCYHDMQAKRWRRKADQYPPTYDSIHPPPGYRPHRSSVEIEPLPKYNPASTGSGTVPLQQGPSPHH